MLWRIAGPLVLVGAAVLYGVGTASATVPRWIVVYLGAITAGAVFCWHVWRRRSVSIGATDLWLIAVVGYVALSVTWSPDWRQGLYELANITALAAVFAAIRHSKGGLWHEAAWLALIVGLVDLVLFPHDTGGFGNRNFAAEFVIIASALALSAFRWSRWSSISYVTTTVRSNTSPSPPSLSPTGLRSSDTHETGDGRFRSRPF